ncbi:MAG: hypothetical protein HYX75_16035 [Acidobacteria bacterium]|nr:hypothetical protein [Acidobacteriota bacterium]
MIAARSRLSQWKSGLILVLLSIGPHHLGALEKPPSGSIEQVLAQLERKDRLRVTDSEGHTLSGRLAETTMTAITLQPEKGAQYSVAIPTDRIRSLERRRDSLLNGALIGMAVGGGAVVAMEVGYNDWSEPGIAPAIAAATAVGGCVGAIVDALICKPRLCFEAAADRRPVSLNVSPHGAGFGKGVLVTLGF